MVRNSILKKLLSFIVAVGGIGGVCVQANNYSRIANYDTKSTSRNLVVLRFTDSDGQWIRVVQIEGRHITLRTAPYLIKLTPIMENEGKVLLKTQVVASSTQTTKPNKVSHSISSIYNTLFHTVSQEPTEIRLSNELIYSVRVEEVRKINPSDTIRTFVACSNYTSHPVSAHNDKKGKSNKNAGNKNRNGNTNSGTKGGGGSTGGPRSFGDECCVSCGGISACACAVYASCGSCCIGDCC